MATPANRSVWALWLTLSACSGVIDTIDGEDAILPPAPDASVEFVPGDDPLPSIPQRIWRLTPLQYERAFVEAFGRTSVTHDEFGPDPRRDGYDNIASQNHVDAPWAFLLSRNAKETASALEAGFAESRPCLYASPATDECLRALIDEYGGRAFRRPVSDDEYATFVGLFHMLREDNSAADSITAVLEAIAQSPHFLYRVEVGEPRGDVFELDSYSIASQLSFMLTDAPPDELLMADAAAGLLQDRAKVAEHAARLLDTPEALQKFTNFFDQYLGVFVLANGDFPKDPDEFPDWDAALQSSMLAETRGFIEHVIFDAEGTLDDLFRSNVTYIDETMRLHYGWEGTANPDIPFEIADGTRGGVFMHAAYLASHSGSLRTDALHRGLFIYEHLLCKTIAPPEGLDLIALGERLESPDPLATERQKFERFQETDPECAGCHSIFVPLGLSLENFDAVGAYRETQHERLVDPSGRIIGVPETGPFANGREMLAQIGASPTGQACFAEHFATYALGGHIPVELTSDLTAQFREAGMSIRRLAVLLTQEDSFYEREMEVAP